MSSGDTVQRWELAFGVNATLKYTAGRHVFREGAAATDFYVVREGLLKLSCNLSDGRHTILGLRHAGEFAGKISLVAQTLQSVTATAVVDSTVIRVPVQEIRTTIQRKPDAAELLITMLEDQLETTAAALVDQKTLTAPEIVERLFRDVEGLRTPNDRGALRFAHEALPDLEVAELVGVSAEHFSRIKKRLIGEGRLVRNRGALKLPASHRS